MSRSDCDSAIQRAIGQALALVLFLVSVDLHSHSLSSHIIRTPTPVAVVWVDPTDQPGHLEAAGDWLAPDHPPALFKPKSSALAARRASEPVALPRASGRRLIGDGLPAADTGVHLLQPARAPPC